jgi:hypothetical protein
VSKPIVNAHIFAQLFDEMAWGGLVLLESSEFEKQQRLEFTLPLPANADPSYAEESVVYEASKMLPMRLKWPDYIVTNFIVSSEEVKKRVESNEHISKNMKQYAYQTTVRKNDSTGE